MHFISHLNLPTFVLAVTGLYPDDSSSISSALDNSYVPMQLLGRKQFRLWKGFPLDGARKTTFNKNSLARKTAFNKISAVTKEGETIQGETTQGAISNSTRNYSDNLECMQPERQLLMQNREDLSMILSDLAVP